MSQENVATQGLYYSVIDGTFRRRVPDGTPGAVRREYETKDGTKGVKHEMVIDSLEGRIVDMGIHEGDFGRQLSIKLDPNADGVNPNLQFSAETTYGEDVLKKLPHVDFSKDVKFRPFAFTDQDNGKEVRGIEISQDGEKYKNFFWDYENKKPVNGHPELEGDTDSFTKDDWKIHFMKVRKFLIGYFTDNLAPKMQEAPQEAPKVEEIGEDGIPF